MADEDKAPQAASDEQATRAAFDQLTAEDQAKLLGVDKIEALSEEEIAARLSGLDSGDVIGHEELVTGMATELSAQSRVIGLLSDQREEESLNIAKVLDSSKIDLSLLMAVQVKEPTSNIIGKNADPERRHAIRSQITLPTSTAFQMCLRSVFIRIGRVAITASGIFLGIAFFASVKMTALILAASAVADQTLEGDEARTTWLIVMALLVSVVGICNSMLMAVTERFQEIGTMKCLGALDAFIVKLFLIESGVLGALAGVTGSLVGCVIMYIVNTFRYQFKFGQVAGGMLQIIVLSVVLGTVLSVVAAILPARQAARMPAAAALRTTV